MFIIENTLVYEVEENEKICIGNKYKIEEVLKKFDTDTGVYVENTDIMQYIVNGVEGTEPESFDLYDTYILDQTVYCAIKIIPKKTVYTVKEFFDIFANTELYAWIEALDTPFATASDVQKNIKVFDKLITRFDIIDVENITTRNTLLYLAQNSILPMDKITAIL